MWSVGLDFRVCGRQRGRGGVGKSFFLTARFRMDPSVCLGDLSLSSTRSTINSCLSLAAVFLHHRSDTSNGNADDLTTRTNNNQPSALEGSRHCRGKNYEAMGVAFSSLWSSLFGSKELKICILG